MSMMEREPSHPVRPEEGLEQLPDWMVAIRQAAAGAVSADDVKAIFAKQVELAKTGDRSAAKFVFEQARAFSEVKGLKLVQNVYEGGARPTKALPGTRQKLRAMQRRAANGRSMFNGEDGPHLPLD